MVPGQRRMAGLKNGGSCEIMHGVSVTKKNGSEICKTGIFGWRQRSGGSSVIILLICSGWTKVPVGMTSSSGLAPSVSRVRRMPMGEGISTSCRSMLLTAGQFWIARFPSGLSRSEITVRGG